MDVTELILHQHAEQRRMFAMLDEIPREDTETLGAVWKRLEILLETHAEAEELFVYPLLLRVGTGQADADDVEEEVEDAIKDHNEIRDGIRRAAQEDVGSGAWPATTSRCGSCATSRYGRPTACPRSTRTRRSSSHGTPEHQTSRCLSRDTPVVWPAAGAGRPGWCARAATAGRGTPLAPTA
jgi:hypothetical protein